MEGFRTYQSFESQRAVDQVRREENLIDELVAELLHASFVFEVILNPNADVHLSLHFQADQPFAPISFRSVDVKDELSETTSAGAALR